MEEDLHEEFQNLQEMEIQSSATKEMIKVPLMNSRVSSRLSILLAIIPCLFVLGVIFAQYLQMDYIILTGFYHWVVDHDQKYGDESALNWILRFLILGGPAVIVFINLLAITHIFHNKKQKEIIFTFKLKWISITIVFLGMAFFLYFFGYLIVENL